MIYLIAVSFFCLIFFDSIFVLVFSPIAYLYTILSIGNSKKDEYKPEAVSTTGRTSESFVSLVKRYYTGFYRLYCKKNGQIVSMRLRLLIYRYILKMHIGKKTIIYKGADIRSPFNITIGEGCIVGDNAILDGRNGLQVGDNVNFSSNVSIWTEQHDHRDSYFRCRTIKKTATIIGDRAWLGPNSIVLPNVSIGEGSVIAAGAVVSRSIDSYQIAVGIPAKSIGVRNNNLLYKFDGVYMPFN